MQVCRPNSLAEALAALAIAAERGEVLRPVAGATDLLVAWHHQEKDDYALLDLSPLKAELGAVRLTDDALEIGALATYWDVLQDSAVVTAFPLLAEAARQVGAVQIQTRGTWAGNIGNGSPAADGVPVLMAYDATVMLQAHDEKGKVSLTEVPLDQYYTGYRQSVRRGEQLIVAIRVPRRLRELEWFYKVGPRRAQAITKVGVAVVKDALGWRIVANSVAPIVCRCRTLERELEYGRRFADPGEIRDVLRADISPIDDIRSTAEYRSTVLSRLLYCWLAERGLAAGAQRISNVE